MYTPKTKALTRTTLTFRTNSHRTRVTHSHTHIHDHQIETFPDRIPAITLAKGSDEEMAEGETSEVEKTEDAAVDESANGPPPPPPPADAATEEAAPTTETDDQTKEEESATDAAAEEDEDDGGVVVSISHTDADVLSYLNETLAFGDLVKFMADQLVDERPEDPVKYIATMLAGGEDEATATADFEFEDEDEDEVFEEEDEMDGGGELNDDISVMKTHKRASIVNRARRPSVSAECSTVGDGGVPKLQTKLNDDDKERIFRAVHDNILFKDIDQRVLPLMVDIVFEVKKKMGATIVRQGDDGENYYIVKEGTCEVIVNKAGTGMTVVETLGPDASFGELALMYNSPRAATIRAKTDVTMWGIDRSSFQKLLAEKTNSTRRLHEGFLAKVPILAPLTDEQRSKLSDSLKTMSFNTGEVIIKQGDKGDNFFILEEGHAVAKINVVHEGKSSEEVVANYSTGDYFGELALLTDKPRAASVYATVDATCVVYMDRDCFKRLMGSCESLMRKNQEMYDQVMKQILNEL